MNDPDRLCQLRFREIPWPVRNTWLKVHPSQITKSEFRRFLFSHCTLRFESIGKALYDNWAAHYLDVLKQRWNTQFFEMHLSPASIPLTPDQINIIEAVSLIEKWLCEFESVHCMEIFGSVRSRKKEEKEIVDTQSPEYQKEMIKMEKVMMTSLTQAYDNLSRVCCGSTYRCR